MTSDKDDGRGLPPAAIAGRHAAGASIVTAARRVTRRAGFVKYA
jgi:hypothetical protein